MSVNHIIVATGSSGNAVIINNCILVDCGVSYKDIKQYIPQLKLVLLTHEHGDHFRASTIRRIAQERPALRFGCGVWLVSKLLNECAVPAHRIDIMRQSMSSTYGCAQVIPFGLTHDVPNCGYKIILPSGEKVFYATDTLNLNGIVAINYDLYLIEADFGEEEIAQRISDKKAEGLYSYEMRAQKFHLSRELCNDFIVRNGGPNSEYVYMHQHAETQEED